MNWIDPVAWGTVASWSGAAVALFSTWLGRHNRQEAHFELIYHQNLVPGNGSPVKTRPDFDDGPCKYGFQLSNSGDGDFHMLSPTIQGCQGKFRKQGIGGWGSFIGEATCNPEDDVWVFIDDLSKAPNAYVELHWIASPTRLMKCRYQRVRLAAEPYPWTWVGRSAYRIRQWWYHRCWHWKRRKADWKDRRRPIQ